MRVMADSHHGGLARSLFLTLQDRLGHELWFPDESFAKWASDQTAPGLWLTPNVGPNGGIPEHHLNQEGQLPQVCSLEQFMDTDWDAIIMTRPESEGLFRQLIHRHFKGNAIKRIGQAGNEGQSYDWSFVPNFLSSDYLSFLRAPGDIHKIHYLQELGRQFCPQEFTPLKQEDLKTINTFINCLGSFNGWRWNHEHSWWGSCPHCDSIGPETGPVSVRDIWSNMIVHLNDHRFTDYGINNTQGVIPEKQLPEKILSGSLTWCYKTHEGFGHAIAQSVSLGRLCLVPRRFHKYRTANQFLIPYLTCLECEWTPESCIQAIRWFTDSLERANRYSEACFHAAKGIFNWGLQAYRVQEFMNHLR